MRRLNNSLDERDRAILDAVHRGLHTVQSIRVPLNVDSPDTLRPRCKRLVDLGYLSTSLDRVTKRTPFGKSNPIVRRYQLTLLSKALLAGGTEQPEPAANTAM